MIELNAYINILKELKLDNLKSDTFGLNDYFPLRNDEDINSLYEDYIERETWFKFFLRNNINRESIKFIIWGESARKGNNQYIYKMIEGNFVFDGRRSNYFHNVKESSIFNESVIIDFFGLFGLNHTNESRKYLNKNASNYPSKFKNHLENNINLICEFAQLNRDEFNEKLHIIAAPKITSQSILKFLRQELKIESKIKIYKLNSRGLVDNKFYYDLVNFNNN